MTEEDGVPVLKFKQWRKKGEIIPEVKMQREKDERRKIEEGNRELFVGGRGHVRLDLAEGRGRRGQLEPASSQDTQFHPRQ